MTYVRPYVNQVLKKHPLGKEFRIIRELILHYDEGPNAVLASLNNVIDYQGPYKGTYQGPYRNFYVNRFLRIIFSLFTSRSRSGMVIGHTNKARRCAEEATKRVEILLKYLDQSNSAALGRRPQVEFAGWRLPLGHALWTCTVGPMSHFWMESRTGARHSVRLACGSARAASTTLVSGSLQATTTA